MSGSSKTVVLLKAEDPEHEYDPYIQVLNKAGISATSIAPIEFVFINAEILEDCLSHPENFSGIIFTSPRTVKAIQQVSDDKGICISKWKEKKNYAVGEATEKLAKSLLQLELSGKEAGNSEELCKLILSSNCECSQPFLFPSSQKSKDTIPKTFIENGLQVSRVICYETQCNPRLKHCWEIINSKQGIPNIIVFFSPSGVEFSHEIIKEFSRNSSQPECIAIGPTTEKAIIKVNMNLCKVAQKPNPDSVLEAIKSLM